MRFHHRLKRLERARGADPQTACRACGFGVPDPTRIVVPPPAVIGAPRATVALAARCPAYGRPGAVTLVVRPPRELAVTG